MPYIANGGAAVTGTAERRTHLIQPGETLGGIARRAGTTVDAMIRANPQVRNPDLIFHGTRITLPPGAAVPAPAMRIPRTNGEIRWPSPPPITRLPGAGYPMRPPAPAPAWPPAPAPAWPPAPAPAWPPAPAPTGAGGTWPAPVPAPGPGILGGITGLFGGLARGVTGFFDGIAGFFERLGWSPQIAKLLVWAIVIGAVGKVLTLRIRV